MQDIVESLYNEAEQAASTRNYIDASLLQAQADLLFVILENIATVLAEIEE
jgi:hypothetical protein